MQTAIIVYQSTQLAISTSENGLQMCSMDNQAVSLTAGGSSVSVAPGIYKIVSSQNVLVGGTLSAFETVTTNNKSEVPPLPLKASQSFPSLDQNAWSSFFAVPDAKSLASV
jgi:hypothetical protein